MTKIIGAGGGGGGKGGGGGQSTPTTAPDSLDSKSYANVLDLLSEGEIQGLKDSSNPAKSIYFNNTPVQNNDGSFNFKDVTILTRNGTSSQTKINGFDNASSSNTVNTRVTKDDPNIGVTRTVATSNATDAVRIIIRLPALQNIEDDGDIVGTSVQIKIQLQVDSGGFVDKITDTIRGRTGDLYKKDYMVTLPDTSFSSAEIRVIRLTNNAGDPTRLNNETWWDSFIAITYTDNTYPNSALVGIRISAEQFGSIPTRAYLVRGIKVAIPSNGTVDNTTGRITYSGVWDGTFGAAQWTSDPAWCLWDLLTSSRYGLGDHISASQLSKFDFFAASQYCSELVDDGFGGTEPRFSCNVCIQGRAEAFTVINSMASVFRAMPYWSAGSLTVSQDKEVTSSYLFTPANVGPEGFTYSGSSQKSRATVAVIKYFDKILRTYAYEEVKDTAAIAKYGVITKNLEAFACTSRGQANRVGRWLLYSEGNETETVTFTTDLAAGVIVRPGQVIDISDPVKAGFRRGGRIKGNATGRYDQTGTTITVYLGNHNVVNGQSVSLTFTSGGADGDDGTFTAANSTEDSFTVQSSSRTASGDVTVNLAPTSTSITIDGDSSNTQLPPNGVSYTRTLHVVSPTGTVETKPISDITGSVITVSSAFSAIPNANSIWIIETTGGSSSDNIQTSQWRVIAVEEADQLSYTVTALSYNSSKYAYVEDGEDLTQRDISNLNEIPATPTGFRVFQQLYKRGESEVRAKIIFSWEAVLGVNEYEVRWRKDSGTWHVHTQQGPDDEILDITPGLFEFKIFSLNAARVASIDPLTGSIEAAGKTRPPSQVSNFTFEVDAFLGLILKWDELVGTFPNFDDLDVVGYEIRESDGGWSPDDGTHGSNLVARVSASRFKVGTISSGVVTYFIKAFDSEGNYSTAATSQAINVAAPNTPTWNTSRTGIQGDAAVLTWNAVSVSGKYAIDYYEVFEGSTSGTLLAQINTTRFQTPVTWSGLKTFVVRAVDIAGNAGAALSTASLSPAGINNIAAVAPTISVSFIDTNVKLSWTEVHGSTQTRSYLIKRGDDYGTAASQGTVKGTDFTVPLDWMTSGHDGTEKYWVTALDANGNEGTAGSADVTFVAPTIPTIASVFSGEQAVLTWTAVTGGSLAISEYEIRRGAVFDSATTLKTVDATTFSVQVDWGGVQKFWVVGIDVQGNLGTPGSIDISVTVPKAPPSFEQEVIDNNVLLRWSDAKESLPIVVYKIRKGDTWAGGSDIGTKQGLFTTVFETSSGRFTYRIRGVDTAGNEGAESTVTASVNQPPDYILRSDINSDFSGTKTNVFTDTLTDILYANVNTTQTWEDHFDDMSWNSPQDQVTAGYTIYGLPSETSGSYVQEVNYGTVLAGTRIVIALTGEHVIGTTTITPKISTKKLSGDSWTDFAGSASTNSNLVFSAFSTDFQFVKYELAFGSSGNDDLLKMTALNLRLESKQKGDSGNGTANASDSGGTTVNFNVSFVDVESITVTPKGTNPRIGIYDFTDVANPTSFKVLLYDTSGNRQSGDFSWQARGS